MNDFIDSNYVSAIAQDAIIDTAAYMSRKLGQSYLHTQVLYGELVRGLTIAVANMALPTEDSCLANAQAEELSLLKDDSSWPPVL